jgi:hypothetical protein
MKASELMKFHLSAYNVALAFCTAQEITGSRINECQSLPVKRKKTKDISS